MEHAPNVGIQDYVVRDFFSTDSIQARQIHKKPHEQEDSVEDGRLEYQKVREA